MNFLFPSLYRVKIWWHVLELKAKLNDNLINEQPALVLHYSTVAISFYFLEQTFWKHLLLRRLWSILFYIVYDVYLYSSIEK